MTEDEIHPIPLQDAGGQDFLEPTTIPRRDTLYLQAIANEQEELEGEKPFSYFDVLDQPRALPDPIELTLEHLKQISYELGLIKLCWPEITDPVFEGRTNFPESYLKNSDKEKLLLLYTENFRQQFCYKYPNRQPLVLACENECGLEKMVCTTIRPTTLAYNELQSWENLVKFVGDHMKYEPLEDATLRQQQQKIQQVGKSKITAPADTSTHAVSSTAGLLTTVDQEKSKHLPKEQQSVNESIWYWLKNQQTKLGLNQNPLPNMPHTNGTATAITTPVTMPTSVSSGAALNGLNGVTADQSSWFWKWYKQIAYSQQVQQFSTPDKPILYQQLTKETPPQKDVAAPDQQNAENVVTEEKSPNNKIINNNVNNNNKARSVLDNLLFNNNNNVAVNKKDSKEDEEMLSQREALEHGEKFLKWLEACSDPSVTAMQIMQFKTLLNNVKTGADRKSGDLQNKTKVKRK